MNKISRLKILVFIDLDITIRHFVKTGAFKKINELHEVVYVFNIDNTTNKKGVHTDPETLGLPQIRYTTIPRKRTGEWFPLYLTTVLKYQRGLPNYKARKSDAIRQTNRSFVWRSILLGLPGIYQVYKTFKVHKLGIHKSVEDLIVGEKPDVLVHPTTLNGYYINELLQITQKIKLPLILLMNSWDNPSAKAVCTGFPNKLVVWGEQSRRHAVDYMKMPNEKIEIFGAAQFQIYRDPPLLTRSELCEKFDIPEGKKIILYAGAGSGRHETKYLKMLDVAVEDGILKDCHILYRPHPWRGGLGPGEEDFFSLKWHSVTMDPHLREYYQSEVIQPTGRVCMIDYSVSNRLLTVIDAIISPLSTMLIEAMTLGKPVLVFFPEEYHGEELSTDEVHFADVLAIPEVNVSLNSKEFNDAVLNLKEQIGNKELSEILQDASKFFHLQEGQTYSERLEQLITSQCEERN